MAQKSSSQKNKKVLVTGASGFIASTLIPAFLKAGYSVTGIDRLACTHIPPQKGFAFIKKDIAKVDSLAGFDYVVHLAFATNIPKSILDPVGTTYNNLDLGVKMLELAKQAGVQTKIGQTDHLLSFIIAIAMPMGSLVITQQIGVAGSQFAGSAFSKIRQTGLKALLAPAGVVGWTAKTAAKAPFQFVGRKVNEAIGENRLPAWMAPAGMVRGWVARREELYTGARQKAAAVPPAPRIGPAKTAAR